MNIFLIVGTPAAGKSSVAKALVQRFPRGIHIAVDDLRHMVVSGLLEPGAEMSENHELQIRLARESASFMAMKYAKAGFAVAIDDFWMPDRPTLGYETLQAHQILLYPSVEATLERLYQRNPSEGSFKKVLEFGVRYLHQNIEQHSKTDWMVVDSSQLSLESTVEKIIVSTQTRE